MLRHLLAILTVGWTMPMPMSMASAVEDPTQLQKQCPGMCFCDEDTATVSCTEVPDVTATATAAELTTLVRRLEYRNVGGGGLSRLQPMHVNRLINLKELSVVRCRMNRLDNGVFNYSSSIERIDFSQNLLTTLTQVKFCPFCSSKRSHLAKKKPNKLI